MHYHILLTENCNSKCKYCHEKSFQEFDNGLDKKFKFDFSSPENSKIDVKKLKEFLAKDPEAVLIFYGGEPLLEINKIKEIMDKISVPFRIQTNGLLLDKLPVKYINRIDKILVSLDGSEERTDYNRGKGNYKKVMNNLVKIKKNGYVGEIIARMTISQEFSDLFEQVKNLIFAGFTSIHWQIDCGFYKFDFEKEKIKNFFIEYNKSLSKLTDYWLEELKKGNFIRLYPFVGIIDSLLKNETTLLRCGAGHTGFAITTSGKIVSCPIMNCIKNFKSGDLLTEPKKLKKFSLKGRCIKCSDKDLCGGRCLYWNYASLWPEEGDDLICQSVKHYLSEMKRILPKIKKLINEGKIKMSLFEYEKYFGPEIIP